MASGMSRGLKAPVMALYHGVAEPLLALRRKHARLAACGVAPDAVPILDVRPLGGGCACDPRAGAGAEILDRYVLDRAPSSGGGRFRLMPMAIDLDRFPDVTAFETHVKKRSSRTLPKVRKAERLGYGAKLFPPRRHVIDVHAVKTSMRTRAAGPVLDYWLLRPEQVGRQATKPVRLRAPACPGHWTLWWGAFLAEPGHAQGGVAVDERLVGYMKLTRIGDLVHYTDLMGHGDHLEQGVMWLMHLAAIRWLLAQEDPATRGVRVVLYGAAEHGGEGLLTWKRRAGFEPAWLVAER